MGASLGRSHAIGPPCLAACSRRQTYMEELKAGPLASRQDQLCGAIHALQLPVGSGKARIQLRPHP